MNAMSAPDLKTQNDAVLHLPGTLFSQIKSLAETEHTEPATIVYRAIRNLRVHDFVRDVERLRKSAPPTEYTDNDVEGLVEQVREELYRARRS
jgi:hypothetical protein